MVVNLSVPFRRVIEQLITVGSTAMRLILLRIPSVQKASIVTTVRSAILTRLPAVVRDSRLYEIIIFG